MATDREGLQVVLEGRITDLEKKMARADGVTTRTYNKMSQGAARTSLSINKSMGQIAERTGASFAAFGRSAAAGIAAALSVQSIARAAAAYTDLTNKLKVTGLQGDALAGTFRDLFEIAQRNGTAIEPLVTLYSRLSQAQAELGVSGEELTRFTEGIAVALRAGSADAQEASGALLQLGQALGGSVVRAEEFNSLLEGTPTVLQTVATGLEEAGGSVSKLRNLVLAGKVSSEAFFRAFLAGMPQLEQKAAKATGTVSQGMTRVSNALIAVVGELDKTTGASEAAATNLSNVGKAIEGLPGYINTAVAGLKTLRTYLSDFGNLPIWRRIGEAIGVDYSAEGMAGYGITKPQAAQRAGSSRGGGTTMARTGVSTVSIADAPVTGDKATRERLNDYQRLTAAIGERRDAINAETAAQAGLNPLVNDYGFALEKARAQYDLMQAATEAGLKITPTLQAQIDALATSYADASVAAGQLAEEQGKLQQSAAEFNDLGRDVLGGFISDMQRGVSAAQALEGALGKVADKLLDMALNAIFPSTGGAGLFSSLFGGAPTGLASGGPVRAATGGRISGPGTGTSDSIPARLSNGEYVVNADATRKNRALLDAINNGVVRHLADGGAVVPRLPDFRPAVQHGARASGGGIVVHNNVQTLPGTTADTRTSIGADGSLNIMTKIRQIAREEALNQLSPGSRGGQMLQQHWGVRRSDLA